MVGEKVILHVRMGNGDAHYAGNLVNGARMLDFFGDVATELLIRMDGDEGLFRTYEYHGWIESAGNTSRRMKFEAYKIIVPAAGNEAGVSAADVLAEPILVGKAEGICVVPKACQRGAQDPAFER